MVAQKQSLSPTLGRPLLADSRRPWLKEQSLDRHAVSLVTAGRLRLFTDPVINRRWRWMGVERLQPVSRTSARRRSRLD
jgi:hypothetical protein